MTYRELQQCLSQLSEDQLDMTVSVLQENNDGYEVLSINDFIRAIEHKKWNDEIADIVEGDQPVLVMEGWL